MKSFSSAAVSPATVDFFPNPKVRHGWRRLAFIFARNKEHGYEASLER
jgi:hypothetical protein